MSSIWTVRRSATDAKLAGVCGGVAEHWRVDPVLVRLGCVLLTLSGGVGAVLYLAGWLFIPVQGRSTSHADGLLGDTLQRWPREVRFALVGVACLTVLGFVGSASAPALGAALAIGCLWRFRSSGKRPASPPPTDTVLASAALHEPDPEVAERAAFLAAADPVGLYTQPAGATALQPPVRRRDSLAARRLRLLTVLVLGLVLGGFSLLDRSGADVVPAVYAASALLVVGLALVAATWCGRARGLLAVGWLLVPVVALTALAGAFGPLHGSSERTRAYSRVADLPITREHLGSGRVTVDLSGLRLTERATYRAHLAAGRLEVVVPPEANVELRYDVDYGKVDAFGTHEGGVDLVRAAPTSVALPNRPTLVLDLAVNGGELVVRR